MKKRRLAVIGATGSIGTQALDVARRQGYEVDAITCRRDIKKAESAIREFGVKLCGVEDEEAASLLRAAIRDTECKVVSGKEAAANVAAEAKADTVLNSVTGIAGLMPTVRALESGKELALANKESLVAAGEYVMGLAKSRNTEILPVDSEHCAVWQSLRSGRMSEVKKIILTASGGPFFGYTSEMLAGVTPDQALAHPTWNMGAKITVDSATLMNKGFEVIEASWLFGVGAEKIDVIVHRESIIHSMVEYKDNAVISQMGTPDMRTCIQYAMTYPERAEASASALDLASIGRLTFYKPDEKTFPLLRLARQVLTMGGSYGASLNGANEAAVELFLCGRIGLLKLFEIVEQATLKAGNAECTLDAVFEADKAARACVYESVKNV